MALSVSTAVTTKEVERRQMSKKWMLLGLAASTLPEEYWPLPFFIQLFSSRNLNILQEAWEPTQERGAKGLPLCLI